MIVTAATIEAEMRAATERQRALVMPIVPHIGKLLRRFLKLGNINNHLLFPDFPKYSVFTDAIHPVHKTNYTFSLWNEHFPKNRREQYERGRGDFESHPTLMAAEARTWCKVQLFVKREKLHKCG